MDQLADLLAHRLDDARRAVAEQVAAPAGEEVEVAVAPRRPRPTSPRRAPGRPGSGGSWGSRTARTGRSSSASSGGRRERETRQELRGQEAELAVETTKTARPTPAASVSEPGRGAGRGRDAVGIVVVDDLGADAAVGEDLQSSECRSRPSMMCVLRTPGLEAGQAGLDLGDHPLVDHALGDQLAALVGGQTPRSGCSGSFRSRRMPGVSVRNTSFSAWSAGPRRRRRCRR